MYAALDLELFAKVDRKEATSANFEALERVLSAARHMAASARVNNLSKAIAGLLPSNEAERRVLIEILAICGVLAVPGKPGYLERFTTRARVNEDRPGDHSNDWSYPAVWWRGEYGVNESIVQQCFPMLRSSVASH